jgi:hypothetical protein
MAWTTAQFRRTIELGCGPTTFWLRIRFGKVSRRLVSIGRRSGLTSG